MNNCNILFDDFIKRLGFQDNEIQQINSIKISKHKIFFLHKALKLNEYLFYSLLNTSKQNDGELYALAIFLKLAYKNLASDLNNFNSQNAVINHYSALFTITLNDNLKNKKFGITNVPYATRLLNKRILRLSCLEFQEVMLKKTTSFNKVKYKKNTKAINILIYNFTKFTYEKAVEDLKTAFLKYKKIDIYVCSHWLISPTLAKAFDETHDITKFYKLFEIYHEFKETKTPEFEIIQTYKNKTTHSQIENDLLSIIEKYSKDSTLIGTARGIFHKNKIESIL